MPRAALHRFEVDGRHYAIDPESCFCFECDAISRDVLEHYPHTPLNRILSLLEDKHSRMELEEVVGELEWLRSAKSILQVAKIADLEKLYTPLGGLRKLGIKWSQTAGFHAVDAFAMLLGRSGSERDLLIEILCSDAVPKDLLSSIATWQKSATAAGKTLSIDVRFSSISWRKLPAALQGHDIEIVVACKAMDKSLEGLLHAPDLGSVAKWMARLSKEMPSRVVLRPGHSGFSGAARSLRELGFQHIELDVDAVFTRANAVSPAAVLESLAAIAKYYADALLKRDLFRLDPVAGLFLRIYQGTPLRRADPAGLHELCVEALPDGGTVYASRSLMERRRLKLGNLRDGGLDEALLAVFENGGALTTAACTACWARNLCGGGTLSVHDSLTGSVRDPAPEWCAAQRHWLETAVAAFNQLSTAGINFSQVYESLSSKPKLGVWQALKFAVNAPLGLRPIADADAAMLARWENWSEAAYFLAHEAGTMTVCPYDREMDAVHPRGYEQEFVIGSSKGESLGLLRLRPMLTPGLATAWVFLARESDYASASVRRGFVHLLELLPQGHDLTRVIVPVGPSDMGLAPFLEAAGFTRAGESRDALYLHGRHHPLTWYERTLKK